MEKLHLGKNKQPRLNSVVKEIGQKNRFNFDSQTCIQWSTLGQRKNDHIRQLTVYFD
jgi:hypothetical protein